MAQQNKTVERPQVSPSERAAKKAAAYAIKLRRDRVRMLDGVQTLLRHAAAAIATDQVGTHNEYLNAAENQLEAYKTFVEMTRPTPADDPE